MEDMKLKIRRGVCMVQVCDEFVLAASREARGLCPDVSFLNEDATYYWKLLEQGKSMEQMVEEVSEEFQVMPEEVRPGLQVFLKSLLEAGYLYEEE